MIRTLTRLLRDNGVLEAAGDIGYNITLVTRGVMNVAAHAPSGAFLHIRVKEKGFAPGEYDNCFSAWQAYPRYVPELLGRHFHDAWEIIVFRGVPHRTLPSGAIAEDEMHLAAQVVEFLRTAGSGGAASLQGTPHRDFLSSLRDRADDAASAAILERWIKEPGLDGVPHVRQHGDLVVNNFGIASGQLVVFDWEDFGRVTLPGLDLCTLVASDAEFRPEVLHALCRGDASAPASYLRLIERTCPAIGVTREQFVAMIPLYLAVFLDLKREYGKAIGARVRRAIAALEPRSLP